MNTYTGPSQETIATYAARFVVRIKAIHDARHPECGRWYDYQYPLLTGNQRKPVMTDGYGCEEHHVWLMRS